MSIPYSIRLMMVFIFHNLVVFISPTKALSSLLPMPTVISKIVKHTIKAIMQIGKYSKYKS